MDVLQRFGEVRVNCDLVVGTEYSISGAPVWHVEFLLTPTMNAADNSLFTAAIFPGSPWWEAKWSTNLSILVTSLLSVAKTVLRLSRLTKTVI